MGLINPKPRFAYDDESGMIYDYQTQRDVPLTPAYSASDGVWDLVEVKRLILASLPVESARIAVLPAEELALHPDPQDQEMEPMVGEEQAQGAAPIPTPAALSVAQLLALKLSPLQAAALGITPAQMTATGVTAEQVAAWGLTPARAEALKLTPEQRAVLLP